MGAVEKRGGVKMRKCNDALCMRDAIMKPSMLYTAEVNM